MVKSAQSIVARDLVIAASNVTVAATTASVVDTRITWWVSVVAAGVSVALFAFADRSALENWSLGAALASGVVLFTGAVWWFSSEPLVAVIPPIVLGLGVGTATNRVLFGIINPLPELRRRRENVV
jgi:hypothetical protein